MDSIQLDSIWVDSIQLDSIWVDSIQLDSIQCLVSIEYLGV